MAARQASFSRRCSSPGAQARRSSPAISREMADDLQRIQSRMAQGDKSAYAAQLKQLKAMGAAIASAKPETWKDKRQVDSLVIYVLSGGALGRRNAALEERRDRRSPEPPAGCAARSPISRATKPMRSTS